MDNIKILILEHDSNDLELLFHSLRKSELVFNLLVVETSEQYEQALRNFRPDIILSDYCLPSLDGLSAFYIRQQICPQTPFIIVSGVIGEEKAVELIKTGITDYVLKEKIYQVLPKILRALNETAEREQKHIAEKKLRQGQEQLQKILDCSLDMICTFDKEGHFLNVGAACHQLLGYLPGELIGRKAFEFVYPEDTKKTKEVVFQVLNGTHAVHFENRYIRKDGQVVSIFWTARWDENEKVAYCVARDASPIKKVEKEKHEQNEQLRNILESITDGFLSVDYNWIVRYYNNAAEQMLLPRENILNKNLWEVFNDAIESTFYFEYHRVMKDRVPSQFEAYYPILDMWVEVSAYPSKDGISIFFKNVTEKKRLHHLNKLEKAALHLYTEQESTIEDIIKLLISGIHEIHPDLLCNILRAENGKLYNWSYSGLPIEYIEYKELNDGIPIQWGRGSCGTAAFLREKVVVTDIATDPLWQGYRELANEHQLKACSSYPILDATDNILGTFAIYLKTCRALKGSEELTIERATQVLQHILQNYFAKIAIKESEQKYHDLFDRSPLPMWVMDAEDLRFLSVNESAARHYGYNVDEFLGMNILDIRPQHAHAEVRAAVETSKKTGRFSHGTFEHLKKNGELIHVFVQSNQITFDNRNARLVLAIDVTENIKIQQDLEFNEKRFKALVQEGSDIITILDKAGNYNFISPAFFSILGYKPEYFIGKNAFNFIHPEDRERVYNQFEELLNQKRVTVAPFRFLCNDGSYRWLESIATNLLNDPSVFGIIVNSRDITESITYLKAIEDQNEKLQEISWMQSHVVRAPLANILGLIDVIVNFPQDEQVNIQLLEHIFTSARQLDEVIRQIVNKAEHVKNIRNKHERIYR